MPRREAHYSIPHRKVDVLLFSLQPVSEAQKIRWLDLIIACDRCVLLDILLLTEECECR